MLPIPWNACANAFSALAKHPFVQIAVCLLAYFQLNEWLYVTFELVRHFDNLRTQHRKHLSAARLNNKKAADNSTVQLIHVYMSIRSSHSTTLSHYSFELCVGCFAFSFKHTREFQLMYLKSKLNQNQLYPYIHGSQHQLASCIAFTRIERAYRRFVCIVNRCFVFVHACFWS